MVRVQGFEGSSERLNDYSDINYNKITQDSDIQMNNIEELEKKYQRLKKKYQQGRETISLIKEENDLLKKELRDKNILFGKASAGIVLIWHGRIIEVNDTFLEYMGYKADEMVNRNFLNFIHPGHLSKVRAIHKKWSDGKITEGQYDTLLTTEQDEAILCSVESRRVRFKRRASYILNITRLEKREIIQENKREEIENRTELKMADGFKDQLKKRAESAFDLLEVLRDTSGLDNKSLNPIIERLKSQRKSLLRDSNMLEAISSENKEYPKQEVLEINEIVSDAVERINSKKETNNIKLNTYLRATSCVNGNPGALTEAMANLLLFSVAFLTSPGELHITTEENPENIYVYIQDSGKDVDMGQIENIFEPFPVTRPALTHELGMRYVQAVIKRHKGEIEFSTGKGQGNNFQITLPVFQRIKKRKKIDRNKLKKARILIVQAEDIAKELLAHLLAEKGCLVETAGNSLEGLVAIKKKKINMVIADAGSLGMSSTMFIKKCRKVNPNMIVVILGEGSKKKGKRSLKEADSNLIISKPFNIKDAVNRIAELFMVEY